MHSIAEIGTSVPAFLGKLWKMVEDPVTNDLIAWSSTGTSFVIKDEIRFARELLPMYYKHNNMASFIRQLNMYDFHKIVSPDAGSMKLETPDEIKFTHPYFMRGHPYLLDNIKRKIGVSKVLPAQLGEKNPQVINKVLSDVRQMKGRQENLDSRLSAMKMENGALWRELSVLRQKHLKQQQIVNKLIQFLVTIVQQNHNNFSVKRKYHRMLQHHDKSSKQKVTHPDDELQPHVSDHSDSNSNSPMGPVIHELDPAEALLETVVEEAEANTSTADVGDYFLNSTDDNNIEAMVVNDGMPTGVYRLEDVNTETIIGMPEDTLIYMNDQPRPTTGAPRTSSRAYQLNKKTKKEPGILRPKYVKICVPKRYKKNGGTQQKPKQVILMNPQKQMEKRLQQQLQINQNQLEINKEQLIKSEQLQSQCQQQSRLQKTQQQPIPKTKHVGLKHKPGHKRLQTNNKQLKMQTQQGLLLQSLHQDTQSPATTIPFDSGGSTTEVNAANVEPLYMDAVTADLVLPVVEEMPPHSVSPVQMSSPQDFLIGSPMLTNDPAMSPKVEETVPSVTSPVVSSAEELHDGDMQVMCVEDPTNPTPNIVARTTNQHILSEMDSHIDTVQNDLDSLKELLRSEGISLDANTLLGYFNDDPLSYNFPDSINSEEPKESSGNELMAFNPSMLDFNDLMGNDWSLPTSPGETLVAPGTTDDSFAEVNTPQFVPQSPSFPIPTKKRKK